MAALTVSLSALNLSIRSPGGAYTPPAVRAQRAQSPAHQPQSVTRALSVGGGYSLAASLSKIGGASWLTIPATCTDGAPFNVTASAASLKPGDYSEVIRATRSGFDSVDCVVRLSVRPAGLPPG